MGTGTKTTGIVCFISLLTTLGLASCLPPRARTLPETSGSDSEVDEEVIDNNPPVSPDPSDENRLSPADDANDLPVVVDEPNVVVRPPAPIDPNRPASGPTTRFLGRFDLTNPNAIAFAFSASSMITRFLGTGIDIELGEQGRATYNGSSVHNFYDVFVDGIWHKTIEMQGNTTLYAAADNLPHGDHRIRVSKRTEAQLGTGIFFGFRERPNSVLLPAPLPKLRKIEFVGDSITCGYGSDGNQATSMGCLFDDKTENAHNTFAAQIADAVDAEFIAIAYSGKGMVQNYDCINDKINTMAKLYPSIIPLRNPNVFDSNQWTPQAVVVNLGTNDYKMANGCPAPDSNAFTNGWTQFLSTLRSRYPAASIFCTVGPDLYPPYLAMAENNIQAAILQLTRSGDPNIFFIPIPVNNGQVGWGCGAHPNKAMHTLVADKMLPLIRAQMHW